MIKQFFTLLFAFTFVFGTHAQHQQTMRKTYNTLWKKVEAFEEKSLPKSASETVNEILCQAIADNNSPQIIKAIIYLSNYEMVLDKQNDTLIFKQLNERLAKSANVVEKALLHSMLGELYLKYYEANSFQIDRRTELGDFVPDDMHQWTRKILYNHVVMHLNASLEAQSALENERIDTFSDIIKKGKDATRFFPTMYDFLARRAIVIFSDLSDNTDISRLLARRKINNKSLYAPAEEFVKLSFKPKKEEYGLWTLETYRKYLSSLLKRDMHESLVLTELDKISHLQRIFSGYDKYEIEALETLLKRYENNPISVEIVSEMQINSFMNHYQTKENVDREKALETYYNLLQKTIRGFPKYERVNALKNNINTLIAPTLNIKGETTFAVQSKKTITASYRNLSSIKLNIYRITGDAPFHIRHEKEQKILMKNMVVSFPEKPPYLSGEQEIALDIFEPGMYKIEFNPISSHTISDKSIRPYYFAVSDLSSFSRSTTENESQFFVVNRQTGKPLTNAQINIYARSNYTNEPPKLLQSISVDKNGMARYTWEEEKSKYNRYYQATTQNDKAMFLCRLPSRGYNYSHNEGDNAYSRMFIYTDRSIYRPGQTVYFKAIATKSQGDDNQLIAGHEFEFILRDANWQEVARQTHTTNEFGSVSGEFVLPQNVMPGDFMLKSEHASIRFKVEEYKRPTFEVTFEKLEKTYTFGEEVMLKGKAENYSGVKLQNADVAYRIIREKPWWWRWDGSSGGQFAEGVTTTDENGEFFIRFTPEKEDNDRYATYQFRVEAVVTDMNGETQEGRYSVGVSDQSMFLSVDISEKYEKSSDRHISIVATNMDGNSIPAKGNYQLFSLQANESLSHEVLRGTFETGEQKALKQQIKNLPSGKYRIKLTAKDSRGNDVEATQDFILFAYTDKEPPVETNDWFLVKNSTFSSSKNAEVLLGATDVIYVLRELWQSDKLISRSWEKIDNENRMFSIPYRPEYEDGVTLLLTFVKEEKFYHHKVELQREKERTELQIGLSVFRDKIRPGSDEEWRLSIKDAKGTPAVAEVLASMYDFSLEQLYNAPAWNLYVPMRPFPYTNSYQKDKTFEKENIHFIARTHTSVRSYEFNQLNWFGFTFSRRYFRGLSKETDGMPAPESYAMKAVGRKDMHKMEEAELNEVTKEDTPAHEEQSAGGGNMSAPQIRKNFAETTFFYPQLRTDVNGETLIAFRVPESNTKWRFRVLAHDKNLAVGKTEAFAISQKELMVTPNLPRFFRHGDVTSIAVKISNLSDAAISGNATIEFIDPVTEKVIEHIVVKNASQPFSLAKEASANVSWSFTVPDDVDVLGVRIVAGNNQFSDGEQHAVAVLPNRMLVTESMRMNINGSQTKTFTMSHLAETNSPTAQNYRLTLEFASNPAWYAVQALPVMSNPEHDNAVSWFASYYVNQLGMHIGKTFPKVSAMIDAWKKEGGDGETLLSKLEKNEELKNILLEETPWVLEAKNESEQKQRMALLFDINRSKQLTSEAIEKLQELQTPSGGWSWIKDFMPSHAITLYVLYGFTRLKALNAVELGRAENAMLQKAVSYIDAETLHRFEEMKKHNKKWKEIKTISTSDLEYLYVRAFYPDYGMDKKVQTMADFYTSVVEKNWTQFNMYERSLIAVLMQKKGNIKPVNDIIKSYREHATITDEMGMFWRNNAQNAFMSMSAVCTHTFIMEAFRVAGADDAEMDNMKRWLLKQKQTQLWESTHATIDAIYALLSTGSDWFSTEGKSVITIADKVVEPEKTELGTGYFKTSWQQTEIRPEMGRVKIEHQSNGSAWGALYWQYFEDLDNITKTDASLNIEKIIFKEQVDDSGKKLVRVTTENPLRLGDKAVVRLTVRTDRDIEFVHIKDMRAACFEPTDKLSGTRYHEGVLYYQATKDASTNFYFDTLPRGTYVFEYSTFVNRVGDYSNGITTIQCLYAPEFTSHTAGMRIFVKE